MYIQYKTDSNSIKRLQHIILCTVYVVITLTIFDRHSVLYCQVKIKLIIMNYDGWVIDYS